MMLQIVLIAIVKSLILPIMINRHVPVLNVFHKQYNHKRSTSRLLFLQSESHLHHLR